MTAVGLWVKQLVLVVLLAVFADMLLPTKSMQRYVRMVLGLAVIAVMVKPVLPVFRQDWAAQVASRFTQEWTSNTTSGIVPTPDLSRYTTTLQQQQQQDADAALATELTQQIADTLQVQVKQVTVSGASLSNTTLTATIVLAPTTPRLTSVTGRIRQFAAAQLGIPLDRVLVRTG